MLYQTTLVMSIRYQCSWNHFYFLKDLWVITVYFYYFFYKYGIVSELDPKQIQPEFATLGYSIRELEARLGLYYCTWFSYFLVTVL